jgi:hypothetical protein
MIFNAKLLDLEPEIAGFSKHFSVNERTIGLKAKPPKSLLANKLERAIDIAESNAIDHADAPSVPH